MLEGLEIVSRLIYHYALVEQIYIGKESGLVTRVQRSIVLLYVSILRYLNQALNYFSWGKIKRAKRGLIGFVTGEVKDSLIAIDNAKRNVDSDASQAIQELSLHGIDSLIEGQNNLEGHIMRLGLDQKVRTRYLTDMLEELKTPFDTMTETMSVVYDQLEENKLVKISDWLSTIQHENYHSAIQNGRLKSSGKWLLTNPIFRRWKSSNESTLLWIHGILGSGKTNLASIVIDHLRSGSAEGAHMQSYADRFAFFYCSRNEAGSDGLNDESSRAEPVEVLRSLVKQLSGVPGRADLEYVVKDKYQQLKRQIGEPRRLDLSECVATIITLSWDIPTTIVIDALDECAPERRIHLIKGLNEIISNSNDHVRIFLTTRRLSQIATQLELYPSIEVTSDKNGEDIRDFVSTQIEMRIRDKELLGGKVSEDLKAEIQATLVRRAGGMFWYASLQLSLLCDPEQTLDEETVREMLAVLPSSLEGLYARMIDDIDGGVSIRHRVTAQNIMKWLLYARAPLSSSASLEAISSEFGGKEFRPWAEFVTDACKTLVTIDEENDVFQFAHLSVREYLEKRTEYSAAECHLTLAERCLRTVDASFGSAIMNQKVSDAKAQFAQYASLYWPVHYQNIDLDIMDERKEKIRENLKDLLIQGQDTTPAFKQWLSQVNDFASHLDLGLKENKSLLLKLRSLQAFPETSLFTACVFGFSDVIEQFGRNRQFNFDLCNVQKQTALCLAVENNQMGTVRALLEEHRTDVNKLNDLAVATFAELEEDLQSNGMDVLSEVKVYASALQAAAVRGSVPMATYLLHRGANIGLVAGFYGSSLQAAALNGHESLVSLFLDQHKAEPNSQGGFHGNALQAAATCGNVHIVALLISQGALISTPGGHYGSALMAATCSANIAAVKVLLNAGANVDVQSQTYGTPMQRAADMDNEDLVQLFIKKGADINAHNTQTSRQSSGSSNSTLAAAAWGGHKKIVSILLKNGARTDLRSQEPRLHILHQAATYAMLDLAEYCLNSGECPIDMKTNEGRYDDDLLVNLTPLSIACAEGHVDMVQLLLSHGASLEHVGEGLTLLHLAARHGHARVVTLLIEKSLDTRGEALTRQFVDEPITKQGGDTALHEAAWSGSVKTVSVLLDHNALYTSNRNGVTPLHIAAWKSKPKVIQLLLESSKHNGINGNFAIDARNMWGKTPLIYAAHKGHHVASVMLVENGADYTVCDNTNNSPLHYAASRGYRAIVTLLLSASDKGRRRRFLEIRNADKNTALNEALTKGYYEVVRLLLAHGATWYPNEDRESVLHVAVVKNIDHTRQYLRAFAEYPEQLQNLLESRTPGGLTPLHLAAEHNKCEAAKLLLDHGADFASLNHAFRTPLHWATQRNHATFAQILLATARNFPDKFHSFINQASDLSTTALHEAIIPRHENCVELLLNHGADFSQPCPKSDNQTALHLALIEDPFNHRKGYSPAIMELLLHQAQQRAIIHPLVDLQTNDFATTALAEACQRNIPHAVKLLLESGADYRLGYEDGATPLHAAAYRGYQVMVELLLESSSKDRERNPEKVSSFVDKRNDAGYTALCSAAEQGHTEIVDILLRKFHADYTISRDGFRTPLHLSIQYNHVRTVKTLLAYTAEDPDRVKFRKFLNAVNHPFGKTALMEATETNRNLIVKLILEHGADYSIANCNTCTTLHVAATQGYHEIFELILRYGAKDTDQSRFQRFIDVRNLYGKTALMDAMEDDRKPLVQLLVDEYHADYTIVDNVGCTALHWGASRNKLVSVELLLRVTSQDSDKERFTEFLNHSSNNHQTALVAAIDNGHPKLVDLLLNKYQASYLISDLKEYTLLHVAADKENAEILRIILAHVSKRENATAFRAWVNNRDELGRTALSKSILAGDAQATKLLYEYGAI